MHKDVFSNLRPASHWPVARSKTPNSVLHHFPQGSGSRSWEQFLQFMEAPHSGLFKSPTKSLFAFFLFEENRAKIMEVVRDCPWEPVVNVTIFWLGGSQGRFWLNLSDSKSCILALEHVTSCRRAQIYASCISVQKGGTLESSLPGGSHVATQHIPQQHIPQQVSNCHFAHVVSGMWAGSDVYIAHVRGSGNGQAHLKTLLSPARRRSRVATCLGARLWNVGSSPDLVRFFTWPTQTGHTAMCQPTTSTYR